MKYCLILFAVLSALSICNTTLLWRINTNPPAYLFGTVHVPFTDIWSSLSSTVKSAFYNSTHFVPEFDITNLFSLTRFQMCLNSPTPPTPQRPPSGFMSNHGPRAPLLDIYLTLEARHRAKTIDSLESAEMYCEFANVQMEIMANNSTSNMDKSTFPSEENDQKVKHAYNCDLNCRDEFFTASTNHTQNQTLSALEQRLEEIVERREVHMIQKINNLLKGASSSQRYFFALGFVHLMAPTGIVTKLSQDYKYSITRLCTDPSDFRTKLGCQGPSWCDL